MDLLWGYHTFNTGNLWTFYAKFHISTWLCHLPIKIYFKIFGPNRDLNPGPPAPKAGIIPLDHLASYLDLKIRQTKILQLKRTQIVWTNNTVSHSCIVLLYWSRKNVFPLLEVFLNQRMAYFYMYWFHSSRGRVVKASDSKSDSLWERRFESYRLRISILLFNRTNQGS